MAPCSETRAGERRGRPRLPGRRAEKPRVRGLRAASWGGAADTPSLLPFSPVRVPPQTPAPGTQPVRSPDTCCSFVKLHVPTKLARFPGRESPSDLLRARPPGGKGLAVGGGPCGPHWTLSFTSTPGAQISSGGKRTTGWLLKAGQPQPHQAGMFRPLTQRSALLTSPPQSLGSHPPPLGVQRGSG